MPTRGHIELVACEPCRQRKIKCDGETPACSACSKRQTECAYTSEPGVARSATLRAEHNALKAAYNNLAQLHERMKLGSALEASNLLERIKLEEGIPDMMKTRGTFGQPMDHTQPAVRGFTPAEGYVPSQGKANASFGQVVRVPSYLTTSSTGAPEWWCPAYMAPIHTAGNSTIASSVPVASSSHSDPATAPMSSHLQEDMCPILSASHKVLLWPAVFRHIMESGTSLVGLEMQCIRREGSSWLWQKELQDHSEDIPRTIDPHHTSLGPGALVSPALTIGQANQYSTAYFNTFNVLSPLLDFDLFMDGVVIRLSQRGYNDDDPKGVLVYLVLALGQLAVEGVLQQPIGLQSGELSGFRGGTTETPPGQVLFHEACRRIGGVDKQYRLEHVQILLLQATYFEASAKHSDFWNSTSVASVACVKLIQTQRIDWSSSYGDLASRAYWICTLQERLFDIDLRVASTGIEALEDQIPLPRFQQVLQDREQRSDFVLHSNESSCTPRSDDYAYNFAAMVTLSRLMRSIDDVVRSCEPMVGEAELLWQESCLETPRGPLKSLAPPTEYTGAPLIVIQELLCQLDTWRETLPQRLRWSDEQRFGFTEADSPMEKPHASFFSSLRNVGPNKIDHNVDVAVAQLRTRFYHARFLLHRPFVYKALHKQQLMTAEDRARCVVAIDAACLWPLSLAPPKNKKYLVPHLFSWTQNFLAMLILLEMCRSDKYLCGICEEGGVPSEDIESSIGLMFGWLEDVKKVDGIAKWSARLLGPILHRGQDVAPLL